MPLASSSMVSRANEDSPMNGRRYRGDSDESSKLKSGIRAFARAAKSDAPDEREREKRQGGEEGCKRTHGGRYRAILIAWVVAKRRGRYC